MILTSILFFQTQKTILPFKTQGDLLAVDKIGNVFSGNHDVIIKYDKNGKKLNTYSSKLLGKVSSIDVSNPLRYLVYYQEIGQIIFLDNTLSVHNEIALSQHGFDQTLLACSSNNDSFWIYDAIDYQLIKLNDQIVPLQKSGNLIQLLNKQINPNYLIEASDKVYLNDPNHGIFVFDIYGSYIKTIPILGLTKFYIINNQIVYYENQTLVNFSLNSLTEQRLSLNDSTIKNVIPLNNQLYIETKEGISIKPL